MSLPIPSPRAQGLCAVTEVPLYWARHGREGADQLLVLHGGPGAHHDYLLPQMLRLGAGHDLLFYDQRGGGRSRTDDIRPITWHTHVADLAAVAGEFRVDPLTLVGYSWGGLLALLYAIEAAAGRVPIAPQRLILIDPAPLSRQWREEFEREFQRRQNGDAVQKLRRELADSGLRVADPTAFRQRQFELSVAGYFANPERARDLTPFRVTGKVQQSVWESLRDVDVLSQLSGIRVPTLLVHGWQDPIPAESSFAAARALGARCVVLEASGHVPYVEQPDTLFGAIEQFLQESS